MFEIQFDRDSIARRILIDSRSERVHNQILVTTSGTLEVDSLPKMARSGHFHQYYVDDSVGKSVLQNGDASEANKDVRRTIKEFKFELRSAESHLTRERFAELATVSRPENAIVPGEVVIESKAEKPFDNILKCQ